MDNFSRIQGISSGSETRASLDQFRKISLEHLLRIGQTQQSLQKASIPFQEKGDVRPIHCKLALDSLKEMNECIEEFGLFFYNTPHLPLVVTALRYQILHILHRVETQTSLLEELIDSYRTLCMTPSKDMQKYRNEIYDTFETLLQSLADISQQVRALNDEARFEKKRLISISQQ